MPIVWKVTSFSKYSVVIYRGDLKKEYEIGKTATADIGGLLCFKRLKDAINWTVYGRIFKARAEIYVPLGENFYSYWENMNVSDPQRSSLLRFKHLWTKKPIENSWPTGTVAYKKVTLLKEYKEI